MTSFTYNVSKKLLLPITRRLYEYNISGIKNLSDGPSIIAVNQTSDFDAPALYGALLPRIDRPISFVSRKYPWLLFGLMDYYLKKLGHVMVSKHPRDALRALRRDAPKVFGAGSHLGIFPEGVRVQGPELGKFYNGMSYVALDTGRPIVPVFMSDLYDKHFGDPVDIRIGEPIYGEAGGNNGGPAKRLTEKVRDSILEMSAYPDSDSL
jgi:1-acyl-sn-glycerol-3-phosphate acyltransferase